MRWWKCDDDIGPNLSFMSWLVRNY